MGALSTGRPKWGGLGGEEEMVGVGEPDREDEAEEETEMGRPLASLRRRRDRDRERRSVQDGKRERSWEGCGRKPALSAARRRASRCSG